MITVYLPTHNRASLLRRSVDSVLAQDYGDFELIVIDDGSSDNTSEYLKDVIRKDPRVRVLTNPRPLGACVSRNRAIREARGSFITGLDDDDFVSSDHLSSLLAECQRRSTSGAVAIFPRIMTMTSEGQCDRGSQKSVVRLSDLLVSNFVGNQIFASEAIWRRTDLFDEKMPAWQDYEMWLRFAAHVEAFYCTGQPTYIQDESHDMSRTTRKHFQVIHSAFRRCVEKHFLEALPKERLKFQLNYYSYPQVPMSFSELWKYFRRGMFLRPSYHFLKKRVLLLSKEAA